VIGIRHIVFQPKAIRLKLENPRIHVTTGAALPSDAGTPITPTSPRTFVITNPEADKYHWLIYDTYIPLEKVAEGALSTGSSSDRTNTSITTILGMPSISRICVIDYSLGNAVTLSKTLRGGGAIDATPFVFVDRTGRACGYGHEHRAPSNR